VCEQRGGVPRLARPSLRGSPLRNRVSAPSPARHSPAAHTYGCSTPMWFALREDIAGGLVSMLRNGLVWRRE